VKREAVLLLAAVLSGCAGMPRAPADSCMQQAVDSLQLEGLPPLRKHCLAAGTIAARCGGSQAVVAGYAKEIADALGPGDASRDDLRANRAGRECATASDPLADCCARAGY
jgi:hypothetical protein